MGFSGMSSSVFHSSKGSFESNRVKQKQQTENVLNMSKRKEMLNKTGKVNAPVAPSLIWSGNSFPLRLENICGNDLFLKGS